MKAIRIPIIYKTEESKALESLDIEYPLAQCDIQTGVFLSIDNIIPYEENGFTYAEFSSGGTMFISSLSYNDLVHSLIEMGFITHIV